ncbi:hypothetical protein lerEdw1_000851 [Lerista edwardsae]|nr:hypothetical protein lerEdw1_000851 [Lerista edwardsae]
MRTNPETCVTILQNPAMIRLQKKRHRNEVKDGVIGLTYRNLTEGNKPWYLETSDMDFSEHYIRPNLDEKGRTFSQKYAQSLKTMIPIRWKHGQVVTSLNPMDNAGLFSFATYSWLSCLMFRGYNHTIDVDTLPPLSYLDSSEPNARRFRHLWEEELARVGPEKASLGRVAFRFQRTRILMDVLVNFTCIILSALGPTVIIHNILHHVESGSRDIVTGIGLCVALFATEFSKVMFWSLAWAINYRTAIRLKVAVSTVAFENLLEFKTLTHISVGEVINLLANDGFRMFEAALFCPLPVGIPLLMLICTVYSCLILGPNAVIGTIVYMIFIPLQMLMAKLTAVFRRAAIVVTDKRVRVMNEILTCIKLIKMYAWEKSFAQTIRGIRKAERRILEKAGYVQSVNSALTPVVTTLAIVLTFSFHTLLKQELTASTAFSVVAMFNVMKFSIAILPFAVKAAAEANVSLKRLKKILIAEIPPPYVITLKGSPNAVEFEDATLSWERSLEESTQVSKEAILNGKSVSRYPSATGSQSQESEKSRSRVALCAISFVVEKMQLHEGTVSVDGTLAYVPQQAWIFHGTVQENILFGEAYDKERYNLAIKVCSLKPDLEILPYGDMTEPLASAERCNRIVIGNKNKNGHFQLCEKPRLHKRGHSSSVRLN